MSFDEAKKDESKRLAYLEQTLGKLVHSKAKNPKGVIEAWYFMPSSKHVGDGCHCAQCANAALKAAYKKDGRAFYFDREIKGVLAPTESGVRTVAYYREDDTAGSANHAGLLLVGDIFALASEDEAKSAIEDYALTVVRIREEGLKTEDRELDANIPALKLIAHTSLIKMWAQSVQLEKVFNRTRKVSDAFKQEAIKQYLATHKTFSLQLLKEHKVYDDNNENTLQKEIIDYLDFVYAFLHKRISAVGFDHKLVDKATQEYILDPKK